MAVPAHSTNYMSWHPNMMHDSTFSGFQRPPFPQDPSVTCHQCLEFYAIATSLRTDTAVLKAEVLRLQAEKRDAEQAIKYVLRQNVDAANESTGPDAPNRYVEQLLRKAAKAKMEKDSMQSMLKHALKIISQMSPSSAGNTRSLSPTGKVVLNVDEPLIDLGIGGPNDSPFHNGLLLTPLNSINHLQHDGAGAADESSVGIAGESDVVVKVDGSDSLPGSPYIFHFERASSPAGVSSADRILVTVSGKPPRGLIML
jgi:hypothetical protein